MMQQVLCGCHLLYSRVWSSEVCTGLISHLRPLHTYGVDLHVMIHMYVQLSTLLTMYLYNYRKFFIHYGHEHNRVCTYMHA